MQAQPEQPNPEPFQVEIARGFQLLAEKKFAEVERICRDILVQSPQHPKALYQLGVTYCIQDKYEQGLALLEQVNALTPGNAHTLYNLGVAYMGLKRLDEAAAAYREALAKDPVYVFAHNNLGKILYDTGQLPEAAVHLRRVMELDPRPTAIPNNLILAETFLLPTKDWPLHCNKLLLDPAPLSNDNRYIIMIHRARAEWVNDDMNAFATTLWGAANIRPARNPMTENSLVYEDFLNVLHSYRKTTPLLYGPAPENIFVIGDSHCLSYANTRLQNNGKDLKVLSLPVVGGKAWHIASDKLTPYKVSLRAHISRLPAGAPLLCSFGEIDCRMNTGILPFLKKTGGKLDKTVKEQVARYVAAMQAEIAASPRPLAFLAVPPPHPKTGDRRDVVRLFNAALEKEAQKAGCGYIDIYRRTVGKDGYIAESFYIDEYHLKPGVLQLVMG